jgi:hypothetical protein
MSSWNWTMVVPTAKRQRFFSFDFVSWRVPSWVWARLWLSRYTNTMLSVKSFKTTAYILLHHMLHHESTVLTLLYYTVNI